MHGGTLCRSLVLVILASQVMSPGVGAVNPGPHAGSVVLAPHAPISIDGDTALASSDAVTRGSGTSDDPYVIEGWDIDATWTDGVSIRNTTRSTLLRNLTLRTSAETSSSGVNLFQVQDIRIENLTAPSVALGVAIRASDNVSVLRSVLLRNGAGIWIAQSTQIAARDNEIRADRDTTYYGIYAVDTDRISISGNRIALDTPYFGNDEILLETVTNATIEDNVIGTDAWRPSSGSGIWLFDVLNATIRNNTLLSRGLSTSPFSGASWHRFSRGAEIYDSYTITPDNTVNGLPILFRNRCQDLVFDRVTAGEVIIANCAGFRVSNMTFSGLQVGLLIANSSAVLVTYDRFVDDDLGWILIGSFGSVYHNDFVGSGRALEASRDGAVRFDAGYPAGGNYWGDSGTDVCSGVFQDVCPDSDGIRDKAAPIFPPDDFWTDRYPLTTPINATNTWPTASFEMETRDSDVSTSFVFNASAVSDREDPRDALQVRWDFDGDGGWDTDWTNDKLASHRFTAPGVYPVAVEVRDSGGLLSIAYEVVVVPEFAGWRAWLAFTAIPLFVFLSIAAVVIVTIARAKRKPALSPPPPSSPSQQGSSGKPRTPP